jgi:hypothetical protein
MKHKLVLMVFLLAVVATAFILPTRSQNLDEPTGKKTLAATMKVYVFPKAGQSAEQQSQDEATCYDWAVQNTGSDPFELLTRLEEKKKKAELKKQEAADSTRGAGARGAVRGALAGALIGEIADDDAGEGAAIGAGVGAIRARRRARADRAEADRRADAKVNEARQATEAQIEDFRKAFSVCLEAKDYLVKY